MKSTSKDLLSGQAACGVAAFFLGLAGALGIQTSQAQSAAAQEATDAGNELAEVVVTARRRSESLQEVPISITAVSADDLDSRNIENTQQLSILEPNLQISGGSVTGASDGNFAIRGIPHVAIYYDGVARSGTQGLLGDITEVDHIEILRGPQGTLFGKNAIGGAIQYVSKAPTDEFGARVKLTAGALSRVDAIANIDMPLSSTVLTKLTVADLNHDGYVRSLTTGREYGSETDKNVKYQILWKPGDSFRLWFIGEYTNQSSNGQAEVTDAIGGTAFPAAPALYGPAGLFPPGFDISTQAYGARRQFYNTEVDPQGWYNRTWATTLNLSYDFSELWSLRSITGWRHLANFNHNDLDGTSYNLFEQNFYTNVKDYSEEVQAQFTAKRLNGTVGLYYSGLNTETRTERWLYNEYTLLQGPAFWGNGITGSAFTAGLGNNAVGNENRHNWAVFTEWNYSPIEALTLTAGVRYTKEFVTDASFRGPDPIPQACCYGPSGTTPGAPINSAGSHYQAITPRASIQYHWTPDFNTYFTYSKGFTAGGINTAFVSFATVPPSYGYTAASWNNGFLPYGPEFLNSFEFGEHSEWLDHRLRLNAALFYGQYTNIQEQAVIAPNTFTTLNVAKAISEGVEVSTNWLVTRDFKINLSGAYLETAYRAVSPIAAASGLSLGSPFAYAPKWSGAVGAEYGLQIGPGKLTPRFDYGYQARYVLTAAAASQQNQPAYGLLSANVAYQPNNANWSLALYGTNLTDKFYYFSGFVIPRIVSMGTVGRPREYGIQARYTFK